VLEFKIGSHQFDGADTIRWLTIRLNSSVAATIIGDKILPFCSMGSTANLEPRFIWQFLFDRFVRRNCRSLSVPWLPVSVTGLQSSTKVSRVRIRLSSRAT
jgi:hypothetical protein